MPVRVGFGKASIWGSWRTELRLLDAIEVTCLAVQGDRGLPALLLVADVCGMWPSTCERLRAAVALRAGTGTERIAVYCTQNHGAPMEGPGVYNLDLWEASFIEAAEMALRSLEPCTMAVVQTIPAPSGLVRRRVGFADAGCFTFYFGFDVRPDGSAGCARLLELALRGLCTGPEHTIRHPMVGGQERWPRCGIPLPPVPGDIRFDDGSDTLLQGVFFRRPDGKPIGSVSRWPAHPVTANAFGSRGEAGHGGDYPLYVRKRLAREFGGGAVFLTGPCGDQAPLVAEKSRALAERTGYRVAGILLEQLGRASWAEPDGCDARSSTVTLPIRPDYPASVELAAAELDAARGGFRAARESRAGLKELKSLSEEIERLSYTVDGLHESWCGISPPELASGKVSHTLSCLRVGNAVISGLPGEPFGRYSVELRDRVRAAGAVRPVQLLVAEECNGYLSYIPTADEFALGGYGPAAAILAPGAERILVEASASLVRECTG